MASVEKVRAGIALANVNASESIIALELAISELEKTQGAFTEVTLGSTNADVAQANELDNEAVRGIGAAMLTIKLGISTRERYAKTL